MEAFLLTQGGKPFDFEKNHPGVRVGEGWWGGGWGLGSKFGPNDKRQEKNFRVAITPERCKLDM